MSTNFRTPYCPSTTTVDRELVAVYRQLHAADNRAIGRYHAERGHKGSPAACNACRDELRRRREESPRFITNPDAEATA